MSADKSLRGIYRREAHIAPSPIVTKSEVQRLEAMRAKPSPHPAPRPKYIDHAEFDNSLDKINERRLTHQRTRLMVADFQLNRDRAKAVHKGRAKARFNNKAQSHEREV